MGRTWRTRKRKEGSKAYTNVSGNMRTVNLMQWMREQGWKQTCHLRLTEFPTTGRGLMAKRSIKIGDTLVQIPASLLVTTATVCNSAGGGVLTKILMHHHEMRFSSQQLLAFFLVWERHLEELSPWHKYITSLPLSFSTPHLLAEEHVRSLPGFVQDIVVASKRLVHESWLHLASLFNTSCCEHCKQPVCDFLSWDGFLWAWCCVNTRSVYIEPKLVPSHKLPVNDRDCLALAPYLDMLNHSDSAEVKAGLNATGQFYEICTLLPIKRYNEVFINYGPHSNVKLYTEYGFVLPSNKHDIVPLQILDLKAAFTSLRICIVNEWEKTSFLKKHELLANMFISRSGLSWNTIIALRILQCKINSFHVWKTIAFSEDEQSAYSRSDFCNLVNSLYSNVKEDLLKSFNNLNDNKKCYNSTEKIVGSKECFRVSQTLLLELVSVIEAALDALFGMRSSVQF